MCSQNAFSVPQNGCYDFFTEIEISNFLVLGEWGGGYWGNAYGATAMTVVWIQERGENPCFIFSRNRDQNILSFLYVAREKLQRGTHPFRFVIDR
jgi:hypothetical protein